MEKKSSQTGRLMKSIFNPRVWMDYEQIKGSTNYLIHGITSLFVLKKRSQPVETFEQAMARMGVTEEQLLKRQQSLFRLALLMLVLSMGVFAYTMMHVYYGHFHAAGASAVIFLLILVLAFRYHFWYYQLKAKKLGCSFREWLIRGLLGAKT